MNAIRLVGAAPLVLLAAGCAGYDGADAQGAAPQEAQEEAQAGPLVAPASAAGQYRISVEIPVDDVRIEKGEDLDVDALLDERTAFAAADFHLREVVLIARSKGGGSAELVVDAWASGAVDIPEGSGDSWYEVRIPVVATDAEPNWVVDFMGALDLNLLVAVLEPRETMLAQAEATVREVALVDSQDASSEVSASDALEPEAEIVHSVEVVDATPLAPTVVKEVEVVERPVYHTRTVYEVVDRPVYTYHTSWIYDPARYYVFRGYRGWTYRYFPGTWDWRCYDVTFRLPRHHHHHDRHRFVRHDRDRRHDRRRGDRDRHRGDRDGRERGRERSGERGQVSETRLIASRQSPRLRRMDADQLRARAATRRSIERVQVADASPPSERRVSPRLRTFERTAERSRSRSTAQVTRAENQARSNPFGRRDPGKPTTRLTVASHFGEPPAVVEPDPRAMLGNLGSRSFNRRNEAPARLDSALQPETRQAPRPNATPSRDDPRGNVRTRTFQRREQASTSRSPQPSERSRSVAWDTRSPGSVTPSALPSRAYKRETEPAHGSAVEHTDAAAHRVAVAHATSVRRSRQCAVPDIPTGCRTIRGSPTGTSNPFARRHEPAPTGTASAFRTDPPGALVQSRASPTGTAADAPTHHAAPQRTALGGTATTRAPGSARAPPD